jgi:hypothetical protein
MGLKAKTVMLHAGCGRQVDACRSLAPALNRAPQAGALGPSAAASYSDRARAPARAGRVVRFFISGLNAPGHDTTARDTATL